MRQLLACLLALSLQAALAQVGADTVLRTVTVAGTGTAYGEPDLAILEVGVNVSSEDVAEASAEANEVMERILDALIEAGVAPHDIRTLNYNIWREEHYSPEGRPTAPRFRIVNTVQVTVRDVLRVGEILGLSIGAGANAVGSVQYALADPVRLENAARERAMRLARDRAERLAELAGVGLGEVRTVTETPDFYGGPPVPYRGGVAEAAMDSGVPVAAGQLSVTVTLQVVYAIAD